MKVLSYAGLHACVLRKMTLFGHCFDTPSHWIEVEDSAGVRAANTRSAAYLDSTRLRRGCWPVRCQALSATCRFRDGASPSAIKGVA